jgi:hypothetical protein
MDKKPKHAGGRPPKPESERLVLRSIRLTPAQWEKIDLHGKEWLRALIDRAKPPKP